MAKTNGHCFEFTCLILIAFGPKICHTNATESTIHTIAPISEFGDSPLWCGITNTLYFIDGVRKTINNYNPEKMEFISVKINTEEHLKFIVARSDVNSTFVVGYGGMLGQIVWKGKSTDEFEPEYFLEIATAEGEVVCSGKADSNNRLWVGASFPVTDSPVAEVKGRLYMVDDSRNATIKRENIGVPTGMAWNAEYTLFYYVDSSAGTIVSHSFSFADGNLGDDGKVIFEFAAQNITGDPHGMTVDTDGNLWVACLKSSLVVKISPNGEKLSEIDLSAALGITNVAFGGNNLTDLYVTSALAPTKPESGSLFCVPDTGSKGIPGMATNVQPPKEDKNVLEKGIDKIKGFFD